MKTKLGNLKKPGKKALAKQGRKLAHRRSISVPDLRFVPGEAFGTDSALVSTTSDAVFFGNSSGNSDSDSVTSGSLVDGPLFADKLSLPETRLRVPTDRRNAILNRISAPVTLSEKIDGMMNSGSQSKVNLTREGLYAQVDKRAKANVPKFTFDPIPSPRSDYMNALSSRPDLVERDSLCGEDTSADRMPKGTVSSILARASSLDHMNPYTEKRTMALEYKKSSSEKGTPPPTRASASADTVSLTLDTLSTPLESADGTSLDSAGGSPTEEQVSMPWTDSEELDQEICSRFLIRDFSMEDSLLEEAQTEEALEETLEVSFITSVFNCRYSQTILFLFEVCKLCRLCFIFRCQISDFLSWSINQTDGIQTNPVLCIYSNF